MSDIAEQLLARLDVIERTGRLGDPPLGFIVEGAEHHPDDVEVVYESGRGEADAVLRHCAADRRIVEWCSIVLESDGPSSTAQTARMVLRLLARGYGLEVE